MIHPRATYRIQLSPDFGFAAAADLAGYLSRLGVSHLYASPYLQAAPGSRHGYDVVDHTRVNHELGGERGHEKLVGALAEKGLGQVLDVVPNHMAVGACNPLWWDVLENGPSSRWAHFFDVDWDPPEAKLRNVVLLPILEDHYGRVLEAGLIRLVLGEGRVTVRYRDHELPLAPRSLGSLLGPAAVGARSPELAFLARALGRLPDVPPADAPGRRERHEDLAVLSAQLRRLLMGDAALAAAVEAVVRRTESDPDALDEILDQQSYRMAYWRTGARELDYRRFFDVDSLVALAIEDDEVFQHTHQRVLAWLAEGVLDGVRIDHPDGLRRPGEYLERLRSRAPGAWIVVEKVLAPGEELPGGWPVQGTTGYDFMRDVTGLMVDPAGEEPLTRLYAEVTGETRSWGEIALEKKRLVLGKVLGSDLERLTHLLVSVCEGRRRYRDYTRPELRRALAELLVRFPVYRTYVSDEGPAEACDRAVIERATAALAADTALDPELIDFLGRVLLAEPEVNGPAERELRARLQQLSGPVMAKAVEDTAFYAWPRLLALNEVGGDPSRFGISPEDFHSRMAERQARWPQAMLSLSTHDTKRGEDGRARLCLLSEVPGRWAEAVRGWIGSNERWRGGPDLPDRSLEYLFYQTMVGAHPLSAERARGYMEKAAREARTHTSWTDPDEAYEAALLSFVDGVLRDPCFRRDLERFLAPLLEAGRVVALSQKLIQLTAPGVPDLYQGSELWDLSLVDPDNRRPVDFALRDRLLAGLESVAGAAAAGVPGEAAVPAWCARLRERSAEGLPKLWLILRALALRAERPDAFGAGSGYRPLELEGAADRHALAFARGGEMVTVVPRLPLRLGEAGGWRDTTVALPPGRWSDRLSGRGWAGGRVALAELLAGFPVALLARERS